MSTQSSLNQQEINRLLTNHYIHTHYPDYFPVVLSNLCFEFINEYVVLSLPQMYLQSLSAGDTIKFCHKSDLSEPYKLTDDAIFELDTCNNGRSLYIRLKSIKLPKNAENIRVLVKILCKQTKYQYIETHKFVNNGRSIHYLFEIYPSECINLQQLDCILHLDLIEIKYKNKSEINGNYSRKVLMRKEYNFDFEISKDILDKHKIRRYINKFYTNPIDDIWIISSHSGRMNAFLEFQDILDILCLRLKLLILPFGLSEIKVKHSIKCLNDRKVKKRKGIRSFKYDNMLFEYYHPKEFYSYRDFYIPLCIIKKSLSFRAYVEVIEVKDINGNIISKNDWNKFNII